MKTWIRQAAVLGLAAFVTLVVASSSARAQESKTAPLVKELVQLLDQKSLDSAAAKVPGTDDEFVAVLYFPEMQLLATMARYSAPTLLVEKLVNRDYREVYIDLNSASIQGSKVFVEDLRSDGLSPRRRGSDDPFDIYDRADGSRVLFNGDWKAQNLSERQYQDAFAEAEQNYTKILTVLIAQLKKSS
ncbi:MAG: hypothetical protein KJ066_11400 [Acidobacteria bacterium]|nr:hypothetical protein [Acidobacteriota bacterium]